jgi:hypothetical protein
VVCPEQTRSLLFVLFDRRNAPSDLIIAGILRIGEG